MFQFIEYFLEEYPGAGYMGMFYLLQESTFHPDGRGQGPAGGTAPDPHQFDGMPFLIEHVDDISCASEDTAAEAPVVRDVQLF